MTTEQRDRGTSRHIDWCYLRYSSWRNCISYSSRSSRLQPCRWYLLYAHFRRHRCYRHPSGSRHRWRRRRSSSSSHLLILSLFPSFLLSRLRWMVHRDSFFLFSRACAPARFSYAEKDIFFFSSSYILTRVAAKFFAKKKRDGSSFHFTKFFCISENIFTRLTNLHFLARARTHI